MLYMYCFILLKNYTYLNSILYIKNHTFSQNIQIFFILEKVRVNKRMYFWICRCQSNGTPALGTKIAREKGKGVFTVVGSIDLPVDLKNTVRKFSLHIINISISQYFL